MNESLIVDEIIQRNLLSAQDILNKTLREKADTNGWPSHLANSLYVDFVNGSGDIQYPAEYAKEIEDLEYGTPDSPPRAFLRTFKEEGKIYAETLENIMIESLFESGFVL